jgi:tetratricopeptide (TPR) repeat protein
MQVKCTSCGAQQNISEAQNCDFCGNVIDLESATNNYKTSLSGESGNLMAMAETAIEATNWEEALQYFNRVLEKDITNSDAWLGKGIAIVYTSKIGDIKINEAIAYWKNALKHAPNQEAMGKRVAKEINEVVNKFYQSLENHFIQFKDLDNSYGELVDKFVVLEKAIDYATQLDSTNIKYCETGYALCSRVIQIPKQYALADEGAAWAQGIIGAVQDNKYKKQDAVQQINKAKARKREISRTNSIVAELEMKYIVNIKRLNPSHKIVLDYEQLIEINKVKKVEKKIKDKADNITSLSFMGAIFFVFIPILLAFMFLVKIGLLKRGEDTKVLMFGFAIVGSIIAYFKFKNNHEKRNK